jgi:hypothetical protein
MAGPLKQGGKTTACKTFSIWFLAGHNYCYLADAQPIKLSGFNCQVAIIFIVLQSLVKSCELYEFLSGNNSKEQ